MLSLKSGNSLLTIIEQGKKYGLRITTKDSQFENLKPIYIEIKESENGLRFYESSYDECVQQNELLLCKGRVSTNHGSEFEFFDQYKVQDDQSSFLFERNVKVINSSPKDLGFSTQFALTEFGNKSIVDYHFFAPGIWYSENKSVVSGAIASDYNDEFFYFRATRLALPLLMMQNKQSSFYLSFCHKEPVPSTGMNEQTTNWLVDKTFQYPSLGVKKALSPSLRYIFPGSEGDKNYIGPNHVDKNSGWARRSHPVQKNVKHNYKLIIKSGSTENFVTAIKEVWRYHYQLFNPEIVNCDLEKVYEIGIQLLNTYCQKYNNVMGLPFWTNVPGGQVADVTFQMGFVGQQLQVAYQLLRYGLEQKNQEMISKGESILKFWCERSMTPSGIPKVWYDVFPPEFKDHPSYIRIASDGMEGALNAWKIMNKYGYSKPEWLEYCTKFADWLVNHQNEDGSFYRSYDFEGKPLHRGKFNTTNPIRFLVNMYWVTDDKRYLETALRAGEFAFIHSYKAALYVGGTADNDNTIDKEAGILALYAFLSLYDADRNEKWLEAAKGAADFCESWVYSWKYPVNSYKGNGVFSQVNITGLSLIATGHSHADIFMSYCAFDFYRLYLFTGDDHYLKIAKMLLYNTKQTTDWAGEFGHAYPGLVEESGMVAMQYHVGLGKWLPWCTIAEIEPLTRLKDWFGSMSIDEIEKLDNAYIKSKNNGSQHLF